MTALISCREISKTFRDTPLFEGLSLHVGTENRIGIIGANGSGKTTLLRILAGVQSPDSGERTARRGLRIGYVPQDSPINPDLTVHDAVYEQAVKNVIDPNETQVDQEVRAATALSRMGFYHPDQKVGELSGGWQKRLALALALVVEPEVLLLDEPTNHLDIEGIIWLENLLAGSRFAYVLVSHDRVFLQKSVSRVIELDRRHPGSILSVEGDYSTFLERCEAQLAARTKQIESLSVKVRNEVDWLRSGVKARSTKAKARIDEAHRLIDELTTMKSKTEKGRTGIDFVASGRKTKRLIAAKSIGKSMGGRKLFDDLDLLLRPKMRLGLLGPNGSGKTTLLKILAEELEPDNGEIRRAEHLKTVYFDQHRQELDDSLTLRRALSEKGDTVIYNDRSVHVGAWAARFRFQTQQLDMPIASMSGGERARIQIAKLMLRPADVLLLDEPTNDLDIPTLEVLEESLSDFPGALVMVTHDRFLLDRISTILLGLDGEGKATYFADYLQWEEIISQKKNRLAPKKNNGTVKAKDISRPAKLTYMEQREFEGMEQVIKKAEAEVAAADIALTDPAVATDAEKLGQCYETLEQAKSRLEALYARWYELELKWDAYQKGE